MSSNQDMVGKSYLYKDVVHVIKQIKEHDEEPNLIEVFTDQKKLFKQPILVRKFTLRREFIEVTVPAIDKKESIVTSKMAAEMEKVTEALIGEIEKLSLTEEIEPDKLKAKLDRSKALNETVKTYINLQKNKIAIVKLLMEK